MTPQEKELAQRVRNTLGSMLANSKYGGQRKNIQLIIDMDEIFGTTTDPRDGPVRRGRSELMQGYIEGFVPLPYTSCEE